MLSRRALIAGACSALAARTAQAQGVPGLAIGAGFFGGRAIPHWNPADKTAGATLSNANLTVSLTGFSQGVRNDLAVSSGSWYIELRVDAISGAPYFGVCNASHAVSAAPGGDANSVGFVISSGEIDFNGGAVTTGLASLAVNDILGMHVNVGTGVRFYKNGAALDSGPTALPSGPYLFQAQNSASGTTGLTILAAAQNTPPSGASYWG